MLNVFKKRLPAFSLFELSLVLCIMGIAFSIMLPPLIQMRKASKLRETTQKMDALLYVLSGFAMQNGYLPYAATPQTGDEQNQLHNGIVPYSTLKLQAQDVKDGFGRWFTYGVNLTVTREALKHQSGHHMSSSPIHRFCTLQRSFSPQSMVIKTSAQTIEEASLAHDTLAVILISHGPSGDGAIQDSGKRSSVKTTLKNYNASGQNMYYDGPYNLDFDDNVCFTTRNNLMALYAKNPCPTTNITQPIVLEKKIAHDKLSPTQR